MAWKIANSCSEYLDVSVYEHVIKYMHSINLLVIITLILSVIGNASIECSLYVHERVDA